MKSSTLSMETLAINTIRTLAMDAVQQANSGHPGTPMALAPVAYSLWAHHLRYDPRHPDWPVRDRFILSCGHASMLLYSMLHLAGVRAVDRAGRVSDELAISLDAIRRFRQLHSPCAGHPEYGEAAGIETTTGPLGQGVANSVGMAIAAEWIAARYNRPGHMIFGNRVFALCSDGDLMEGVASEAASLAGHLKLPNLCWIYDNNRITIEGDTELAFSEDVATRFRGLGWRTATIDDANDLPAWDRVLTNFDQDQERPLIVVARSVIAWGSPNKANTHGAHGAPLGEPEVRLTKEAYGWPPDDHFLVPPEVREHFAATVQARGEDAYARWSEAFAAYERAHPDLAAEFRQIQKRELPPDWEAALPTFSTKDKLATRVSSGKVLNALGKRIPWLLGGAADLAPSTKTLLEFEGAGHCSAANRGGRNQHFGIREHAMASAGNGMALTGLRPYVATFFIFSDYLRPAMRLSAIMKQPLIYIFTHDSIGLGEDGPTHQPVEHLAACRAIPGLVVLRPADANEVVEAYRMAIRSTNQPMALVLTRQDMPTYCRETYGSAAGLQRGAYVMADAAPGRPDVILMGTGSELAIAEQAYRQLKDQGVRARLVSFPSWELFEAQDAAYRESVLPADVTRRVAVEAGVEQGWSKYLGRQGRFVGMASFGASAPFEELYEHFGITLDHVLAAARA
ncbi:MAG TPA: transketolase [Pirellulaceae bacterium]